MKKDIVYMRYARQLALKARGRTSPNPLVGAVVVRDNRIVGKGFHQAAGLPHAEVVALEEAGRQARGATLYVTLEPCIHFGRTPPCVDRIIQSGIKRVVAGMTDPNPLVNGKGLQLLARHGLKVESGLLEDELRRMNEGFIKYITRGMPLVTVKVAQSLDGKIATRTGSSKWISSDLSRSYSHRLRSSFDAIMVGINTVLRDDPRLCAWGSGPQPAKIVVDAQLSTPQDAALFSGSGKVILVTAPLKPGLETQNRLALSEKASILEVKQKAGLVNLRDMLKKLARLEITSILVEGGGTLIGSLFDEGLVDRVMFFVSPRIIGGKQAISSVMGRGVARVESALQLKDVRVRRFKQDYLFEGRVG